MDETMVPATVLIELKQQLANMQSTISTLEETISTLTSLLANKDKDLERLTQLLLNAQRARFGQRSEKSVYVYGGGVQQLSLTNLRARQSATTRSRIKYPSRQIKGRLKLPVIPESGSGRRKSYLRICRKKFGS